MSIRPIIKLPDLILRQVSTPFELFDDDLKRLAADMLETMYKAPGVGLAAIQIGVAKRLIVLDVGYDDEDEDEDEDESGDDKSGEDASPAPTDTDPPAKKKTVPKNPLIFVNPRIVKLGDTTRSYEEGCLSLPDVRVDIERPATVTVAYQDLDGKHVEMAADGLLATALQHEIDHLDGRLIIDFLTSLKRDIIIRRFKKQARLA